MMKRAAKKMLETMGFELRRVNYKFEPKKKDRFKWIRDLDIRTVLDVGAHTGEFAAEIHAILPEATIYSFESFCSGQRSFRNRNASKRIYAFFFDFANGLAT